MIQTLNLNQPECGFRGIITRIEGDMTLTRKLMSLGIRKGQQIEILHQRHNGVVVLSHGSRVALGANIAALVFLQPLLSNPEGDPGQPSHPLAQ